jgi:hypothetical protein
MEEMKVEYVNLEKHEKNIVSETRNVEKNFFSEEKKQQDLEEKLKGVKFEVD